MRLYTVERDVLGEKSEVARIISDYDDVGDVSLVTRTRMGDFAKLHLRLPPWRIS
jgi:hypothetical protein